MVVDPAIFSYIDNDSTILEKEPFDNLVAEKKINAYFHKGFWQCMDTMRDKEKIEELLSSKTAKWVTWDD